MKATAAIFGTEEQKQVVKFEYEYYPVSKWFSDDRMIFVNFCKIKESLAFSPSDIKTDLEIAIAEAIGERPQDIRFECEVEYSVKPVRIIEVSYTTEMLFV